MSMSLFTGIHAQTFLQGPDRPLTPELYSRTTLTRRIMGPLSRRKDQEVLRLGFGNQDSLRFQDTSKCLFSLPVFSLNCSLGLWPFLARQDPNYLTSKSFQSQAESRLVITVRQASASLLTLLPSWIFPTKFSILALRGIYPSLDIYKVCLTISFTCFIYFFWSVGILRIFPPLHVFPWTRISYYGS